MCQTTASCFDLFFYFPQQKTSHKKTWDYLFYSRDGQSLGGFFFPIPGSYPSHSMWTCQKTLFLDFKTTEVSVTEGVCMRACTQTLPYMRTIAPRCSKFSIPKIYGTQRDLVAAWLPSHLVACLVFAKLDMLSQSSWLNQQRNSWWNQKHCEVNRDFVQMKAYYVMQI